MKNNRICELLGIEYPILQGGMLWLADAQLAAAVSNAGALGTLSPYAGMDENGDPVENLYLQISRIRQRTGKPFAVNIPLDLPASGLLVNALLQEKATIAVTAAGSPAIYTELLHSAGIRVLHVVGSVSQAKFAESCGVDALVAEGYEAGGRIGRNETSLISLVPQVVDAVSVPVVAAGGIVDGRGMAAAFALGAVGVQLGTRFIAVHECIAHAAYKQAIVESGAADTVVTGRGIAPVRSLRSRFIENLSAMERSGESIDRIDKFIGRNRARNAQISGDMENGDAYAGSSAGMIREITSASAVIHTMMEEYNTAIRKMDFLPSRNAI
jgi:enoyl-[acyl-carrier protein] reductase II